MLASRFPVGVMASYTRPSKQYAFRPASYLRFDSVIDRCVAFVLTVLVAHATNKSPFQKITLNFKMMEVISW